MKTHIRLEKSPRHRNAIVCGSPERAEWFASLLDSSQPVAKNREYHSFLGKSGDREILIQSHGVGSAGAAICFQELIDAGAERIIRIGTAGGLAQGTGIGDIVVATSAVRKDGVSSLMIPPEFPAVPDLSLTVEFLRGLQKNGTVARQGTVLTTDLFYAGRLDAQLQFYGDAGVVAVEMECSTLFIISQLRGVQAAAALVLDGNPLSKAADSYDPSPARLSASLEACFRGAVQSLLAY